jgi:hypothetical protein
MGGGRMTTDLAHKVYVDLDADGSFATAGDDLSAYWMHTNITAGMQALDTRCAHVGKASIVLNNADRRFSPDNLNGPYVSGGVTKLKPFLPVQITMQDDTVVFRGVVTAWNPTPGTLAERTCLVECMDLLGVLQGAGISLPLQEQETAKTLLDKVCATAFAGGLADNSILHEDALTDGDTLTIGSRTYTFKTTLSGADDEVLIDAAAGDDKHDNALVHLAAALNGDGTAGTDYATDCQPHAYVTAEATSGMGWASANRDGWLLLGESADNASALAAFINQHDEEIVFDRVKLFMKKVGTPNQTINLRLVTVEGYQPTVNLIDANATGSFNEADLDTTGDWVTVVFSDTITIPPYTLWAILIYISHASSGTDYTAWGTDGSSPPSAAQWAMQRVILTWSQITPLVACIYWLPSQATLSANARGAWGNGLALTTTSSVLTLGGATFTGGSDAPAGLTSFEAGQTFPLAADGWSAERTNGLSACQDIAQSEYGLLWAARDGTLTFKGYAWWFEQLATATSLDLSESLDRMTPTVALDNITNESVVEYIPRRSSSAGVVLATANGTIRVPAASGNIRHNPAATLGTITVKLAYVEAATGNVVGASDYIAPVAGTDYSVTTAEVGGATVTTKGFITVSLARNGGDLEASFKNTARRDLFIQAFQVRGTALIAYDRQQIIRQDATSMAAYGKRTRSISLPFPSDVRFAEAIADYELQRSKDPRTVIDQISFKGTRTIGGTALYSLELGAVIAITETQTAITAMKHLIIGWKSTLDVTGNHSLTWTLARMNDLPTWILGDATYSLLGTSTRLGL